MSDIPIFKKNLLTYEQVRHTAVHCPRLFNFHPPPANVMPVLCSVMSTEKL